VSQDQGGREIENPASGIRVGGWSSDERQATAGRAGDPASGFAFGSAVTSPASRPRIQHRGGRAVKRRATSDEPPCHSERATRAKNPLRPPERGFDRSAVFSARSPAMISRLYRADFREAHAGARQRGRGGAPASGDPSLRRSPCGSLLAQDDKVLCGALNTPPPVPGGWGKPHSRTAAWPHGRIAAHPQALKPWAGGGSSDQRPAASDGRAEATRWERSPTPETARG
jgi:hypothetical protein